jgi:hypothetical protein
MVSRRSEGSELFVERGDRALGVGTWPVERLPGEGIDARSIELADVAQNDGPSDGDLRQKREHVLGIERPRVNAELAQNEIRDLRNRARLDSSTTRGDRLAGVSAKEYLGKLTPAGVRSVQEENAVLLASHGGLCVRREASSLPRAAFPSLGPRAASAQPRHHEPFVTIQ